MRARGSKSVRRPDGSIMMTFPGLTLDMVEFLTFLRHTEFE
jgi:hypothetical protein